MQRVIEVVGSAAKSTREVLARDFDLLLAAALPVVAFVSRVGPHFVDPRATAWLRSGDAAQHLAGWSFFASERWSWPPAAIVSWPAPLGTTIGLTDSIPLVALPLKAFVGEGAADLQYFGIWVVLSIALQGAVGALLLRELRVGRLLSGLGGAMFGVSPVLWERLACGHASLGAQWLVLLSLLAWIRFHRVRNNLRPLLGAGGACLVAALVQPYLLLMVSLLAFALAVAVVRELRGHSATRVLAGGIAFAGFAAALSWLGGFVGSSAAVNASGFGDYSFDLGGLLDPGSSSRLWSSLPARSGGDGELAFLGTGALALAGLAAVGVWRGRQRWAGDQARSGGAQAEAQTSLRGLAAVCAGLAVLASLPSLSLFGLSILPENLGLKYTPDEFEVFRANGRLAWPLHFFVLLLILGALRRFESRPVFLGLVLGGAIVLQAAEHTVTGPWSGGAAIEERRLEDWQLRSNGVERIAMVPPYLQDGSAIYCGGEVPSDIWVEPALAAARLGLSFNSGYVARLDAREALEACVGISLADVAAAPDPEALYYLRRGAARHLASRSPDFDCARMNRRFSTCRWRGSPR